MLYSMQHLSNSNSKNGKEVVKFYDFWRSQYQVPVRPAECMQQILELVRCHKVNIDGNVCTVIVMVTTLVLEGWQQKPDPD